MLRAILKEVFGLRTSSKYQEGTRAYLARTVGSAPLGGSWIEKKPILISSTEHYFIKTHEPPEDNERAIVVVRDPRAAIVSYWHFLKEIEGQSISLEDVAGGRCGFGDWNAFYAAWQPQSRPNTLLLRFEELVADPTSCILKISSFTGRKPTGSWNGEFSRFQAIDPVFFRSGNNRANIEEFPPQLHNLILSRCAPMMAKLGY